MKIAIESNDGISITSPFVHKRGYLVVDVEDSNIMGSEYRKVHQKQVKAKQPVFLEKENRTALCDCETIISRGMDRTNLQKFRENGIDVFITFKTSVKDAVKVYLKEHMIGVHDFH